MPYMRTPDDDAWDRQEPTDDPFWDRGEPYEPYERTGGGRMRTGAQVPYGTEDDDEADSGHGWQQHFAPPVRESYGEEELTGDLEPYGGERFSFGRHNRPELGDRRHPNDFGGGRTYGEIYGRELAGYGHRRQSFYGPRDVESPAERRRRVRPTPVPSYRGRGPLGYRRSDSRLLDEVCGTLTRAPWVDASGIEVRVEDGEVTLEGFVPHRQMARDAENLAAEVLGVVDVHNRLRRERSGAPLGAEAEERSEE